MVRSGISLPSETIAKAEAIRHIPGGGGQVTYLSLDMFVDGQCRARWAIS